MSTNKEFNPREEKPPCPKCGSRKVVFDIQDEDSYFCKVCCEIFTIEEAFPKSDEELERLRKINYKTKLLKYNLSHQELLDMLKAQKSCCKICGEPFKMRKGTLSYVIDHDHKTGYVRGLLCGNHNTMLGLSKDDVMVLRGAIEYLEDFADRLTSGDVLGGLTDKQRRKRGEINTGLI